MIHAFGSLRTGLWTGMKKEVIGSSQVNNRND